jgi:SAM-dependent methyltransferase
VQNQQFPSRENGRFSHCGSMEQIPENVSYLSPASSEAVSSSSIGFLWDAESRHTMIENYQPPSYYEDYVMTTSCSPAMQALQRGQASKLAELCDAKHCSGTLVEVGCGDGSFLKHAETHFGRVLGIEPSRRFASEAVAKGLEVVIGYVGTNSLLTSEKFDGFVSRQVFEHLPDPLDVLCGIRQMLKPGAVGLIEVPNGFRALRLKRFFEFFPDHVNYYSVNSLVSLASNAGFSVLGCNEAFGGDYLELWLRNDVDIESWFPQMRDQRECITNSLESVVRSHSEAGRKIAVWGAGAKTLCIFAASNHGLAGCVDCVIDSDPHKHGTFIPNTNIPVVAPADGALRQPDVVFVLALSYREEIVGMIREQFSPDCLIMTLDDVGGVVLL